MIITSLNSPMLETYTKAHHRLPEAIEILKKLAAEVPEDAKFDVDGDNIKAIVATKTTKPAKEKKFELHHKYIDIQYVVRGTELMGNESTDKLTPMPESKPDADFYYVNDDFDKVILNPGEFAIIFPEEAHAPEIAANDIPCEVKKIVLKVLY